VAASMDDQKFGITSDAAVFGDSDVKVDEAIVLFKKFDEGRSDLVHFSRIISDELFLAILFYFESWTAFHPNQKIFEKFSGQLWIKL
jgi:hypothetical protein